MIITWWLIFCRICTNNIQHGRFFRSFIFWFENYNMLWNPREDRGTWWNFLPQWRVWLLVDGVQEAVINKWTKPFNLPQIPRSRRDHCCFTVESSDCSESWVVLRIAFFYFHVIWMSQQCWFAFVRHCYSVEIIQKLTKVIMNLVLFSI